MRRKTQVEIESLHEQLRVRKEKQYHLLEKMQAAEETKRQAEDQCMAMEEKLRSLHARTVELETQVRSFRVDIIYTFDDTDFIKKISSTFLFLTTPASSRGASQACTDGCEQAVERGG